MSQGSPSSHAVDEAVRTASDAYFATQPAAVYGGRYIDRSGRTVVLVTSGRDRHDKALRERLTAAPDHRLVTRTVRYALSELDRVTAVIEAHLDDLAGAGVEYATFGTDVAANRVVFELVRDTRLARAAVLGLLDPADRPLVVFGTAEAPTFQ